MVVEKKIFANFLLKIPIEGEFDGDFMRYYA